MKGIHSKEFKKKYIKSKIKLKEWEDEFKAQNGRLPTKVDIKSSPASIRGYYKLYWKLKIQILEDQILGDEELLDSSHLNRSKSDSVLEEYTNKIETKNTVDADKSTPNTSKENIGEELTLNANCWGGDLNTIKSVSVIEKESCRLMNETVAGRLFKGSSFKKRNPRKSLSFSKKSNKSLNFDDSKSVDSPDIGTLLSPYSDCLGDGDMSTNGSPFSVESDCSSNIKALITSSASLSPLLSRDCGRTEDEAPVQPDTLMQMAKSDSSVALKPIRPLDAGWIERCTQIEKPNEDRKSSDSGFESTECSHVIDESSDDDVIAGSDNELDESSTFSFLSQKRKSEASPAEDHLQKRMKLDFPAIEIPQPKEEVKKLGPSPVEKSKTKEEVKKAILEKKIEAGKLNDNFVKINLKKKVFVRGKNNFNYGKHKKKEWKNKKKDLGSMESGGVVQCYKCGENGHFSRYCYKQIESQLLEVDEEEEEEGELPTLEEGELPTLEEGELPTLEEEELPSLEEAEKMAKEKAEEIFGKKNENVKVEKPEESDFAKVESFYSVNEDGSLLSTPSEVFEALKKFGHSEFRPGQEEAIMRILSGQSTLVTVATGGGKSLCYQLPAYLYAKRSPCITLVVSPLVSLMEDQVSCSSSFFKLGCLHTGQTLKKREAVIEDAKNGKLFALLVSPEAVVSGDTLGFGNILRQLPPIAFACIDEVHCVSQWSHNFRPSYLMLSRVLREKLRINTILGLTATATTSTIKSITTELLIENDAVIKDLPIPDNLHLSVSREENKDEALIQLLGTERFKEANAILVYCTRRDECERLAVLIRTCLQDPAIKSGGSCKNLSWNADSYHAGMTAGKRKQIQSAFMRGNIRIVVATVAFGMGINKQDIRAVIHYNMPKNFESYVQEVGRAGRDGLPAYCHLFLGDSDLNELRRHIHSNTVDRFVLRKLLQRVFIECDCKDPCEGHEVAFDCKDTIQCLDLPEENIHTLLCYLELHEKKFIKVLTQVYINCRVRSYKGMKGIISAAKRCPHLAYACALKEQKTETLEFNVIELANKLKWDSSLVKNQLKKVEWEVTQEGKWKKTGLAVEFSDLGFRVRSRGDMSPSELDEALDYLVQRVNEEEKRSLFQLNITYSIFDYFSKDGHQNCGEEGNQLKETIRAYFKSEEILKEILKEIPIKQFQIESFDDEALASDVRTLICTYRDNTFNGRAVARIFHGIQSPNYPASLWYKCKFWRKHLDKDFNKISYIATKEILSYKI